MGENIAIAINARFKADPEMLTHTIVEEYAHAQQVLDGVDFEAQRRRFPNYADRPYEIEAKRAELRQSPDFSKNTDIARKRVMEDLKFAQVYKFRGTPTFILCCPDGKVLELNSIRDANEYIK